VAVVQERSRNLAAIIATMPLTAPLAIWVVFSASSGNRRRPAVFAGSMIIGSIASLAFGAGIWLLIVLVPHWVGYSPRLSTELRRPWRPGWYWGRFTRRRCEVGLLAALSLIPLSACATPGQMILRDHSGTVSSVTWRPDGKQLASTGYGDGTLRIWDLVAGTAPRVLRHRSRWVVSAVWSPVGDRLVSHSVESAHIWEPDTGREVRLIRVNPEARADITYPITGATIYSVWSPDGKMLAMPGPGDVSIKLVDARSGEDGAVLRGHSDSSHVSSIAWSPDGSRLVSGAWDATVRLWNPATGAHEKVLDGRHPLGWIRVAWSPDGERIVSHQYKGNVHVWKAATGMLERVLPLTGTNFEVAWSPDGKRLAVVGSPEFRSGGLHIWNALTGTPDLVLNPGLMDKIAWSPDGRRLAGIPYGASYIAVWNVSTGSETRLRGHDGPANSIAWDPKGRFLASAGSDGTVRIWDVVPPEK